MKRIFAVLLSCLLLLLSALPAFAATSYIKGDANNDGKVNIRDVTVIQLYLVDSYGADDNFIKRADINGDNKITIRDATFIQMYNVQLPIPYSVNEVVEETEATQPSTEKPTDSDGWGLIIYRP